MTTSLEVLSLIDLLDEVGTDVDYLLGYIGDMAKLNPAYFRTFTERELEDVKAMRRVIANVVKAKQTPGREISDEIVQTITKIVGDSYLDEGFTRLELPLIPGMVTRWKRLRALHFVGLPEERVTEYLRQAIGCYLHGLPTAAAILCRAVLEFALREAVLALGGVRPQKNKEGWLAYLINVAGQNHVLPPRLISAAERIQVKGNRAIHRGGCSEEEALTAITNTRDVLRHLYKVPKDQ